MWLTVLLALCCCCCRTRSLDSIHFRSDAASGAPKGDPLIQRITPSSYNWVDGLFYDESAKYLYWVDRRGNSSVFCWHYATGIIMEHNFPELDSEQMAFVFPIRGSKNGFLIGYSLSICYVKMNKDKSYVLSEPFVTFNEPGSRIVAAKADCDGRLFIVLGNHVKKEQTLYYIENKEAILVDTFNNGINSIAWNNDCSKMYILAYTELIICDYDKKTGKIDNKEIIFPLENMAYKTKGIKFKGISVDNNNGAWFGVEPSSHIVNLIYNGSAWEENLTIKQVGLPTTSYLFGGYKDKNIIWGTHKVSKLCISNNAYAGYGSIFLTTGFNVTGVPNNKPKFDEK